MLQEMPALYGVGRGGICRQAGKEMTEDMEIVSRKLIGLDVGRYFFKRSLKLRDCSISTEFLLKISPLQQKYCSLKRIAENAK